ncbi:hypothetical protein [Streptomyces sp. NPDC088775]|uniref:hypothetical protein n=1 Tax=Streptomyces sp. NPDC088775 TaxID=3365896 RepID=UPI003813DA95
MTATTPVIVFKGRPHFGGKPVVCPQAEAEAGPVRRRGAANILKLYATPVGVLGTCGEAHKVRSPYGRTTQSIECTFPVEAVSAEELQALAAPGKTGRVHGKLPNGKSVDVWIISVGAPAGVQAGGGGAAQAFAAASGGGKGAKAAPARVPRGGGGAVTAFFGAVAATATAAGQVAGAAGQVAGSAASAVGSVASLGKEGVGLARDGVREAGAYGARRHERKMRDTDSDD